MITKATTMEKNGDRNKKEIHIRNAVLMDADDTLWDNNIFYDESIQKFSSLMESYIKNRGRDKKIDVESRLREREMANVPLHGYGSESFGVSLQEIYEEIRLEERLESNREIEDFIQQAKHITANFPIRLLTGVEETLPLLKKKYLMILLTKGVYNEQMGKIQRSGLWKYFHFIEIVPEKNTEVYKNILKKYLLEPENTWMIGNSPRSDINPALAVGMKTVLIPYHTPWEHESQEIMGKTYIIEDFSLLKGILLNNFSEFDKVFT